MSKNHQSRLVLLCAGLTSRAPAGLVLGAGGHCYRPAGSTFRRRRGSAQNSALARVYSTRGDASARRVPPAPRRISAYCGVRRSPSLLRARSATAGTPSCPDSSGFAGLSAGLRRSCGARGAETWVGPCRGRRPVRPASGRPDLRSCQSFTALGLSAPRRVSVRGLD